MARVHTVSGQLTRVAFTPKDGPGSIGELRALSHVDRPFGEATAKGNWKSIFLQLGEIPESSAVTRDLGEREGFDRGGFQW